MALSLRFYRRIETSPPDRQIRYMDHGLHCEPLFLTHGLELSAQYYSGWMDDPLEDAQFEDDNVCRGPNVMWLWANGNKIDCSYFLWQNEPLRKWGYVFWDQDRLTECRIPNEEYMTWVEKRWEGLRRALDAAS